MKNQFKHFISTIFISTLMATTPISAATLDEVNLILDWGQNTYPEILTGSQPTQIISPWTFRFYPETGVYVGEKDDQVFALGGPFGDSPIFIATAQDLLIQINTSNKNAIRNKAVTACESSKIPAGFKTSQNNNVVNITTNGQCIQIPEEQNNFCQTPRQSAETNISVLRQTNISSFESKGIEINNMNIPDPIQTIEDNISGATCIIHAPTEEKSLVINTNICADVTKKFTDLAGTTNTTTPPTSRRRTRGQPDVTITPQPTTNTREVDRRRAQERRRQSRESQPTVTPTPITTSPPKTRSGQPQVQSEITITPPVTFSYVGTSTSTVVSDCFETEAKVITNALTGEIWVRDSSDNFVQTDF